MADQFLTLFHYRKKGWMNNRVGKFRNVEQDSQYPNGQKTPMIQEGMI